MGIYHESERIEAGGETGINNVRQLHDTGSLVAARDDARNQAGMLRDAMPFRPAHTSPHIPQGINRQEVFWAETVAPGGYTHHLLQRGDSVRFTDISGQACAHVVLYNAQFSQERLNVADTIKIYWQAYLGVGHGLLSGDGRIMATLISDTSHRHDALTGTSTRKYIEHKYGKEVNRLTHPAGKDHFIVAGTKYGLTERDIPPSISFFKGIKVDKEGRLTLQSDSFQPGAYVKLKIEMPVILLLANVPHPLDDSAVYRSGLLGVHAWHDKPISPNDYQDISCLNCS